MIDAKLLEILACPNCRGNVENSADGKRLICTECRYSYPVENGIPVMLVEKAIVPETDETADGEDN